MHYLSGKVVDPDGNPVANVSIYASGWTHFDDFWGDFSTWTTSDNEGNFNVTVFNSTSVSLRATPPPESRFGPVSITNIDVTEDKVVLIALVYKPGLPPIANFTWTPTIPKVGEPVTFNASASTPNGGEIVSYEWDFGDEHYASGKIVTHTYTSPGTYTVTLNITDSEGLWDIEQKQIQVEAPPEYALTIYSSPTGVTFTVNGTPQTTPYTEWLLEGSYTLEMPQTHNGYVWSHWLEDGDPNRGKTILLQGTTWTAVYEPAPKPVGGKATPINIPMNKPESQIPWIWLSTIILSLVLTVVYVKKRKRNTEINS